MKVVSAILAALLFISCNSGNGILPQSSGRPYEVTVSDDCDSIVCKILTESVTGLPQSEPSFDVYHTTDKDSRKGTELSRAIVRVDVDSTTYTDTRMSYERNVYAKPQIVVSITSPSVKDLEIYARQNGKRLRNLLTGFEMAVETTRLKKSHIPEAEAKIKKMFGIDMLIPADMQSSKSGRNFIWLSTNTNSGMRNICVYSAHNDNIIEVRDSVMKANIPGERKGMYMKTVASSVITENVKGRKGEDICAAKGLWEMENDAMGGPFVVHRLQKGGTYIYVEAFVYAPESRKRNKIRQTEAVLFTVR